MEPEIMIVSIVAIACATGIIISWINRSKDRSGVEEEAFDRLARAFMQHKKEMKQRVENLEEIVVEENGNQKKKEDFRQIEAPKNEGSLTNDLKQRSKSGS